MNHVLNLSTLTRFVLRFAVLVALTVAVLASVSVRASREGEPPAAATTTHALETASVINSRRYPLRDAKH